jgi:CheY-like chemotaxis protein
MSARILVVDDEPSVRSFVDRVLREGGYVVRLASDGASALALLEEEGPFDLLLTDQVMPSMNGDELARRARIASPDMKVLYLTGFSDSLFHAKATLWSDEAFLDKPCSVAELMEAVSMLLFGRVLPPRGAAPRRGHGRRPVRERT